MKLKFITGLLLLTKITFAQVPTTWTVNPNTYSNQMYITAKANVACVDLVNANNYVAAFVGTQCRGVAQTSVVAGANYIGNLTIHSNVASGEKVKFQIFNSVTNQVLAVLDSIVFSQNTTMGNPLNPFVLNTNHAPGSLSLSTLTITENTALATTVATLSSTDQDGTTTFNYSLTANQPENVEFAVAVNLLQVNTNYDFETDAIKIIELTVDDNGGCTYTQTYTITVIDANDNPSALNLAQATISDKQQANSFMGEFSTIDQDVADTFTYTLVSGAGSTDNAQFHISNDTLYNNAQINYNTQQVYYIRARSTDAGGLFVENTFTLNVINTNDAPTDILLSKADIDENLPVATPICTLTAVDDDILDTHTFALVSGVGDADNAKVAITGSVLVTNAVYNFEQQNTLQIRIRATDSFSATFTKSFTITINDVNDVPNGIISLGDSVAELNPAGTFVDTLSTLDEDITDTHNYTLVSGTGDTDNALFSINSNSLLTTQEFEFNGQTYSIRIRATDNGGLSYDTILKIRVLSITGGKKELPSTNYISPNGDGKNDNWKVENVEYFKEFTLKIFDQYGQVIFMKEKNYNDEFDGKYNGKALPTGNYYYEFKKESKVFKGNITIIN